MPLFHPIKDKDHISRYEGGNRWDPKGHAEHQNGHEGQHHKVFQHHIFLP